jgi:hypothetical protein
MFAKPLAILLSALLCLCLPFVGAAQAQTYALRLSDGTLEFPYHPIMKTGGNATIEYWVRASAPPNPSIANFAMQRYQDSAEHKDLTVNGNGSIGFIYTYPWPEQTTGVFPTVFDGQWHHYAAVRRSNGSWSIYFDGQQVLSGSGPTTVFNGGTSPTKVFGQKGSWEVREFRWSSTNRYNSNFVPASNWPNDAATAMLGRFNQASGATYTELSSAAQVGTLTGSYQWIPLAATLSVSPASHPAATGGPVQIQVQGVPAGPVEVLIGGLVIPGVVSSGSVQVTVPPLGSASAADVSADVSVRWQGPSGPLVTQVLPAGFKWLVSKVQSVQPSAVVFDSPTAVTFELSGNVVSQGSGQVRFGGQAPVLGTWSLIGGKTVVSTVTPVMPAPGNYPIQLRITTPGGITELTLASSGALVFLDASVQSLSKTSGFQGGGEPVTFGLAGFQPGIPVQVAFGSALASGTPVGLVGASTLTVLTPLSPVAGPVDVTLTQNLGGGQTKTASLPGAFTFLPPTLGNLSSGAGPQAGGQALSLPTSGFAPGNITVRLGSTTTQGLVQGTGGSQSVSWTTVASPQPGLADLRLEQGVFNVLKPGAYLFREPQILAVSPDQGSWYLPQQLTISGLNFAPNVPATVRFFGEQPVQASVQSSTTVTFGLPAEFLEGAGPLSVIVTQNGVSASFEQAFVCLPALDTQVSGTASQGGVLRYTVESDQGGFAVALLSPSLGALPLSLPGYHFSFGLNLATSFNLGSGGLLIDPTFSLPFPPLSVPAGTVLQSQALVLEFGPLGTWYSFTNTVPVLLP